MTETQRRIEAYKAALPDLRERVIAVALLLVMSAVMMTSASFAWLTISRAPEVTAVSTTVAANGNLEIALATGDELLATPPGESKIGDSSATAGQTVTAANVTWGNLVNLSDPSYGLENMALRPAQLNKSDLIGSPLYGADYTEDGRIKGVSSNFSYTSWVPMQGAISGEFRLSDSLGVRAISSTKISYEEGSEIYGAMKEDAINANALAANRYLELTQTDKYMNSLAYIMGVYMTDRLNATQGDDSLTNPTIEKEHLENLVEMYKAFSEVFDLEAEALVKLLNFQLYDEYEGDTTRYTPYTVERLMDPSTTKQSLSGDGLVLSELDTFRNDYNLIKKDIKVLEAINAQGTVKWTGTKVTTEDYTTARSLKDVVNSLVNLDNCTLQAPGGQPTKISGIGASNASGYLNKSCQAVITNGVLYNFEKRTGAEMDVGKKYNDGKGLKLEATVKRGLSIDGAIYAIITTSVDISAENPALFSQDMNKILETIHLPGNVAAEDTYGMAIDLWVRTNAPDSFLTLSGNVLTRTENKQVKGKDSNGNEVDVYTLSRSEEITTEETDPDTGETTTKTETIIAEYNLYKVETTDNGTTTTTWYNLSSHGVFELKEGENPILKTEEVIIVLGYEGENRIWDDTTISSDATTQGSGSCYVYYADTPEDQTKSLRLLDAFKVAFVDGNGVLLAQAKMDTAMYYAENGRVTVPLVLDPSDSIGFSDTTGATKYGITKLEKNTATRITAIVYLDGTLLTNEEVLAASDIQGQLNIQFGTSQTMKPIENEDLASKELMVSASVEGTSFDYDTYEGDMISTVTVNVNGYEPSTVKAFFIRAISSTQGSREDVMTFDQLEDGTWQASHKFTAPGNYVLRSVELDGVSYDLKDTPTVTITGFAVSRLTVEGADGNNNVMIFSAENTATRKVTLQFATSDPAKLPKTVSARFISKESTVNVAFKYSSTGVWTGDATFITSGDYTMQYIVLDGEYVELSAGLQYTADVTLGMRVAVYTNSPTSFKYLPKDLTPDQELLAMQVKIIDNAGNEMPALSGAELTYKMQGSSMTMDTNLTWDGKYYTGGLTTIAAGNWVFEKVSVEINGVINDLTIATTSPIFTIIPPEPPEYHDFIPETYQFVPNGGAKLSVQLEYAQTAVVEAVLKNTTNDTEYTVKANDLINNSTTYVNGVPVTTFYFTLPSDTVLGKTNVQDGNWEMKEVQVRGYFDANGNFVSAEKDESGNYIDDPMVIDMTNKTSSGTKNITKAVQTVNVSFEKDVSEVFGKTGETITGTFMQSYTIPSENEKQIAVNVVDFEDVAVQGISDEMTLSFVYGLDSEEKGGYTSTDLTNAVADFYVTLDKQEGGIKFLQTESKTLTYAGTYTATTLSFSATSGGVNKTYTYTGKEDDSAKGTKALPANAPVFTVWSKAPTATITAITPTGTNPTKITWTANKYSGTGKGGTITTFAAEDYKESKFDSKENEATVYALVTVDNDGTLGAEFSNHNGSFKMPTLTLTVDGVGDSDAISLVLPSSGNAPEVTFSRTGNGITTGTLGAIAPIKTWTHTRLFGAVTLTHTLYAYYGYGETSITEMTVTRGTIVFNVTLPDPIKINNPNSVNQLS